MHRIRNPRSTISSSHIALLGILLVTAWLYGHALDFGFIWDDPLWYGRVVGKSIRELVSPMPDFHFYRPAHILYNRLYLSPDNTLVAPLLHAAQIGWHLLNVALVFALSRRLGLGEWAAAAAAGLVAWVPFSYQAVAWAAPAQPMVAALASGALLTYLAARRGRGRHRLVAGVSILLYLAALAVQEGAAALSVLPLLTEWVRPQHDTHGAGGRLWLAYPLMAFGAGLLFALLPRKSGYTSVALDSSVALYFLQGLIFPVLGRPGGYAPGQTIAPVALLALAGLTLVGLLVASWRAGQGRQALFGLVWALLGVAPAAVGLRYGYVKYAARLFYTSSPGVALMWACALLPRLDEPLARRLWRAGGAVLLTLIAFQSGLLLTGFQRMYATGIAHLHELIQAAQSEEDRMLFVNFPDRYAPKRPPYPLGYWGVTLAPISVDLGTFPAITTGREPLTESRSVPAIDVDARDAGPYRVDMRGVITPHDELYQLARRVDGVYLSRYEPDGAFALQRVGSLSPATSISPVDPASDCQLAIFGQTACLQQAQVEARPGRLDLTLSWLSLSAGQPHETIFVHLGPAGQPPTAQADGDAWHGLLPLSVWQPGDTIHEQRSIVLPEGAAMEKYIMWIGLYNWVTGQRLPATTPQGEPLPDDAVLIEHQAR